MRLIGATMIVATSLAFAAFGNARQTLSPPVEEDGDLEFVPQDSGGFGGDDDSPMATCDRTVTLDAEFRLRMLERMLTDVADFRSKLGNAIGAISLLTHEVAPYGDKGRHAHELLRDALKAFAALAGAGPVMPCNLRDEATKLANEFQDALRDVVD